MILQVAALFIIWSTLPLILGITIFLLFKNLRPTKKYAFYIAIDVSTFFLMAAVYFLSIQLFQRSVLSYLLIIVLVVACLFTIVHWKVHMDIKFLKLMKNTWRFCFFVFLILFLILVGYGVITLFT